MHAKFDGNLRTVFKVIANKKLSVYFVVGTVYMERGVFYWVSHAIAFAQMRRAVSDS